MKTFPKNRYLGNVLLLGMLLGGLAIAGAPADTWAQNANGNNGQNGKIGFVIAANGEVSITSKTAIPRPASLRQGVYTRDVIGTGPDSSAKVLFDDNTLLNVSENSRVEITEYIYDPNTAKRSTILKMAQGKLKVLVAEFYAATGSRFEVHTPSAVAAARGTEYVVYTSLVNGVTVTTVAVTSGSVIVTSGGKSVTVAAGQFTRASAAPPAPPASTNSSPAIQSQAQKAEVKTAPAVVGQVQIAMAQPAQYVVLTSLVNGAVVTTVAVTSGSVTVISGGQPVTVAAGQFTTVSAAPPAPPDSTSTNPIIQSQIQKAEVKTAPAVVGQVQIAMAQQSQTAQSAISNAPGTAVAPAVVPPAVPSLPGGISRTMGTTDTPCTFVSPSGNLPLGCLQK